MTRFIARYTLPLLLLGAAACSEDPENSASAGSNASASAIDFELPRLDGKPVALSDYRGQWVVVNYWATWCAPCREEIPQLSALDDARGDVQVLGLAYEDLEPGIYEAFLNDYPASYPILMVDVLNPPAALGDPKALPTTFVVNPAGALVKTFIGPVTREQLESYIDEQERQRDA